MFLMIKTRLRVQSGFKSKIKKIKNPYGDGKASQRIAKVLSDIKINKKLIQKKITY